MNLNQVTIFTQLPVETVEFFEKLGLKRIVDSLPRYARLECRDGEATLSVHVADEVTVTNNIVLYFECEDLDEEVVRLKSLGLSFAETRPIANGPGVKPISSTPPATKYVSFVPAKIAKTRRGV